MVAIMVISDIRKKKVNQGKVYTDSSFYVSKAWRELRARKLRQDPYCECEDCKGKKVIADLVDHIKPIELGGAPLDMSNLQSMRNHPCHDRKRAFEKNHKYKK
jgi:5-methylcytosine-specific restriction enzyme A